MATPAYPGAVKTFGADLENLVNIVYAAHVNDLRAEVVAVETEIGLGLRKSITWANRPAFDRPTSANFTWGDLSLRLTNIEAGLVSTATDIHPQYFLTTGGSLTGPINMGGNRISNLGNGTVSQDAVNLGQLNSVSTVANASLPRAGGAMSGDINMGSNRVTALLAGASPGDAVNKSQLDAVANASLPRAGGAMSGDINMGGRYLLNIGQSGAANDAATVGQVNAVANASLPRAGGAMSGDINMGGRYLLNIGQSGAANDAATVGQVNAVAGRAVGGVGSAMLSAEPIEVTVTTGISPTGTWSVVAVPLGLWAGRVRVVSTMGTTATIRVTETTLPPGPTPATPQPLFFWQAVAY
jgi:hypothetical protein